MPKWGRQTTACSMSAWAMAGRHTTPETTANHSAVPQAAIIRINPLAGDGTKGYGIPPDNPVRRKGWCGSRDLGLRAPAIPSTFRGTRMAECSLGTLARTKSRKSISVCRAPTTGWRLREGTFASGYAVGAGPGPVYARPSQDESRFVYPVAQYDHDEGNAIGGGFVYRGRAIPELRGKYVFAEFARGRLFAFDADALDPDQPVKITEIRLVLEGSEQDLVDVAGFLNTYGPGNRVDLRLGIDSVGELYLLTKGDGWVRKLVPAPPR